MTRIVVVRHGNTFEAGEPVRRIGAATDLPLVEQGRRQAAALGRCFAQQGWAFDRTASGPLRRTRTTAAIILDVMRPSIRPEIELLDWLAEIDHGPDEGALEAEVVGRVGAAALREWNSRAVAPPGWITHAAERQRAWRSFLAEAVGDVLLVTSNGAARFLFDAVPSPPGVDSLVLHTGHYGVVEKRDGEWHVPAWDQSPSMTGTG